MKSHALIVVDVQNDFLPAGALAVTGGNEVIPVINRLMDDFEIVAATQDWHPPDHASFFTNHSGRSVYEVIELDGIQQTLWPVHCVEGTGGAEFSKELRTERFTRVFRKGTDRLIDSYSGFFDNSHRKSTGLAEWLREKGVTHITVCGLATDYCVKFTALDALSEGFEVSLHLAACRGVDLTPGDIEAAIREMESKGVKINR